MLREYAHEEGYEDKIYDEVPCISCNNPVSTRHHRPTPSTEPPLPSQALPAPETFHYTSVVDRIDRSFSDKGFGAESRQCF